jgi:hypothetical protein
MVVEIAGVCEKLKFSTARFLYRRYILPDNYLFFRIMRGTEHFHCRFYWLRFKTSHWLRTTKASAGQPFS